MQLSLLFKVLNGSEPSDERCSYLAQSSVAQMGPGVSNAELNLHTVHNRQDPLHTIYCTVQYQNHLTISYIIIS